MLAFKLPMNKMKNGLFLKEEIIFFVICLYCNNHDEENDDINIVIPLPAEHSIHLLNSIAKILSQKVQFIHIFYIFFLPQLKLQLNEFLKLLSKFQKCSLPDK
jgi:hypothetical protein